MIVTKVGTQSVNLSGTSRPRLEHITGPIVGHYLAAYAVLNADGYIGYAKVCTVKPASAWDGVPAIWKVAAGPFSTEVLAIEAVLKKAERELWDSSEFHVLWDEGRSPRSSK